VTGSQVLHARPKPSNCGQRTDFRTAATRTSTLSEDRIDPVPNQVGHRPTFGCRSRAEFVRLSLRQKDLCSHHVDIITYSYNVMMYISYYIRQ
jgi:hypothetical protein